MSREKAIQLFADGDIWTAMDICLASGYVDLLENFSKSIKTVESLDSYREHYSSPNGRVPGAQIIGGRPDARQKLTIQKVVDLKPKLLLDAGCADGTFLFFCVMYAGLINGIGIDPWKEGIAWAKEHAEEKGYSGLTFINGLVEDISPDFEYDVLHLGEVLEHVIEPAKFLEPLLKPTSLQTVIATVPVGRPPLSKHEIEVTTDGSPVEHVRICDLDYLTTIFGKFDFRLISNEFVGANGGWRNLVAIFSSDRKP